MEKILGGADEAVAVVVTVDGAVEAGDAVAVAAQLRQMLPSIPW